MLNAELNEVAKKYSDTSKYNIRANGIDAAPVVIAAEIQKILNINLMFGLDLDDSTIYDLRMAQRELIRKL
jgi:hypothetical protein